jgi:voltage-gated potassium channel
MIVLYFVLPLHTRDLASAIVLTTGLVLLAVLLTWQVRQITKSPYPRLRAAEALATTLPLFLLLFAAGHYVLDNNTPGSYSQAMTRLDAVYFVVTVFTTVGFGDITPVSQAARVVTIVQMLGDLAFVGVIVRVLLGAVQVGLERQRSEEGSAAPGLPKTSDREDG